MRAARCRSLVVAIATARARARFSCKQGSTWQQGAGRIDNVEVRGLSTCSPASSTKSSRSDPAWLARGVGFRIRVQLASMNRHLIRRPRPCPDPGRAIRFIPRHWCARSRGGGDVQDSSIGRPARARATWVMINSIRSCIMLKNRFSSCSPRGVTMACRLATRRKKQRCQRTGARKRSSAGGPAAPAEWKKYLAAVVCRKCRASRAISYMYFVPGGG